MERLATRQLNLFRKDREILWLDPEAPFKDHSTETLLAESVIPTTPAAVDPIPKPFNQIFLPGMRTSLIIIACAAMALSFFLGVKYER